MKGILLFWNSETIQHGIRTSPGSLKVKESEGKEFFVATASLAVWRLRQEESKGISLYSFSVTVAEQLVILNTQSSVFES